MGLFDFIKRYQEEKNKSRNIAVSVADALDAGSWHEYKVGILKSYSALETIGAEFYQVKKKPSMSAREYAQLLEERKHVKSNILTPLVFNLELALYSQVKVGKEHYETSVKIVTDINEEIKKISTDSKNPQKKKFKMPSKAEQGSQRKSRKFSMPSLSFITNIFSRNKKKSSFKSKSKSRKPKSRVSRSKIKRKSDPSSKKVEK